MKTGELRIVATVKWSQIFCKALKYYLLHAVSWVLEKATNQFSLKTSKLCYEIDDKIFFKSVKFLSQDFAARQCKLMYRKNSHKTSSRFFFTCIFYCSITSLGTRLVNECTALCKKILLTFYLYTSFYDEAVSNVQQILIVCIVFYLYLWYYSVDQFGFVMLFYNTSFVSQ